VEAGLEIAIGELERKLAGGPSGFSKWFACVLGYRRRVRGDE